MIDIMAISLFEINGSGLTCLAIGVNTCCYLSIVLILNIAFFNCHTQIHKKIFLVLKKQENFFLYLIALFSIFNFSVLL